MTELQILQNAKKEQKGNWRIYSMYSNMIANADDLEYQDQKDLALQKLRKILKV